MKESLVPLFLLLTTVSLGLIGAITTGRPPEPGWWWQLPAAVLALSGLRWFSGEVWRTIRYVATRCARLLDAPELGVRPRRVPVMMRGRRPGRAPPGALSPPRPRAAGRLGEASARLALANERILCRVDANRADGLSKRGSAVTVRQ